jgi:hypothetical protein
MRNFLFLAFCIVMEYGRKVFRGNETVEIARTPGITGKLRGFPRGQSLGNDEDLQRLQDAHHLSLDAPQKLANNLGLATPKRANIRQGYQSAYGNLLDLKIQARSLTAIEA